MTIYRCGHCKEERSTPKALEVHLALACHTGTICERCKREIRDDDPKIIDWENSTEFVWYHRQCFH